MSCVEWHGLNIRYRWFALFFFFSFRVIARPCACIVISSGIPATYRVTNRPADSCRNKLRNSLYSPTSCRSDNDVKRIQNCDFTSRINPI